MEQQTNEPTATLPCNPLPAIRHDGWSGEKIATFCETLAETAVVAEACDAAGMGISGAYAARRRNPVFAAAWDAALGIARERLADTLLARSMEGNIEQIYRDGELVGERHVIDNRLGLAILRRLDRLAETGLSVSTIGQRVTLDRHPRPGPVCHLQPIDWSFAIDALRSGDDEGVARALALLDGPALSLSKGDKVEEVEDPPIPSSQGDSLDADIVDPEDHCWKDEEGVWMTSLPPPPEFAGYESTDYGDDGYERECTPDEVDLFNAFYAAVEAEERAEDEAFRDGWLARIRESLEPGEKFAAG